MRVSCHRPVTPFFQIYPTILPPFFPPVRSPRVAHGVLSPSPQIKRRKKRKQTDDRGTKREKRKEKKKAKKSEPRRRGKIKRKKRNEKKKAQGTTAADQGSRLILQSCSCRRLTWSRGKNRAADGRESQIHRCTAVAGCSRSLCSAGSAVLASWHIVPSRLVWAWDGQKEKNGRVGTSSRWARERPENG